MSNPQKQLIRQATQQLQEALVQAHIKGLFKNSSFEVSMARYIDCTRADALSASKNEPPRFKYIGNSLILEFKEFLNNPRFREEAQDDNQALAGLKNLSNSINWSIEQFRSKNKLSEAHNISNTYHLRDAFGDLEWKEEYNVKIKIPFTLTEMREMIDTLLAPDFRQALAERGQAMAQAAPPASSANNDSQSIEPQASETSPLLSSLSASFAGLRARLGSLAGETESPARILPEASPKPPQT